MRSFECSRDWPQEGSSSTVGVWDDVCFLFCVARRREASNVLVYVVTKNGNGLSPNSVELLVLLRHSWKEVDMWEASNTATAVPKRGSTDDCSGLCGVVFHLLLHAGEVQPNRY